MLDFLRTANFGGITLGITREQVRQWLGEPPDWSVTRRRKRPEIAEIWRYGSIEFYFADWTDILRMIFSDHFPLKGTTTLELDPWILNQSRSLQDTLSLLAQANMQYQLTTDSRRGLTILTFKSGVSLNFNPSHSNDRLELTSWVLRQ
jgi:hypothetical protein